MTNPPSIFIVDYHLFASDLTEQLVAWGYSITPLRADRLSVASFQAMLVRDRPRFVLAMNFASPLAALVTAFGLPYVSWTIDPLPPERIDRSVRFAPELCLAFAHRRLLVDQLAAMGCDAHYLPLAAPSRRHPITDEDQLGNLRCDLSFVGGSLASDQREFEHWKQAEGLAPDLKNDLNQELQSYFDANIQRLDFCGLDPVRPGDGEPAYTGPVTRRLAGRCEPERLTYLLNGELGYWHRRRVIEALNPLGLVVYGDEGFADFCPKYRGLAEHHSELTAIYNASRVNIDIPRLYQRDIVTMRVFDVLACGKLVLTEDQPEVTSLFKADEQLVIYRSLEELVRRARELSQSEQLASEIGQRGRQAVLSAHTIEHRTATILDACRDRGWL